MLKNHAGRWERQQARRYNDRVREATLAAQVFRSSDSARLRAEADAAVQGVLAMMMDSAAASGKPGVAT